MIYSDSGQDEGIHMARCQRNGHSVLAKSLPVNVPSFPSFVRGAVQDQDDDQVKFYTIFRYTYYYKLDF